MIGDLKVKRCDFHTLSFCFSEETLARLQIENGDHARRIRQPAQYVQVSDRFTHFPKFLNAD